MIFISIVLTFLTSCAVIGPAIEAEAEQEAIQMAEQEAIYLLQIELKKKSSP